MKTHAVKNLRLKFDELTIVGSWDLPDPNDSDSNKAKAFIKISADIGWHVAYAICSGSKSCTFTYEP